MQYSNMEQLVNNKSILVPQADDKPLRGSHASFLPFQKEMA